MWVVSQLAILFYWSVFLFWHQYHGLPPWSFPSSRISPPILFSEIILAAVGSLHFHRNYRINLSISITLLRFWFVLHWIHCIYRPIWGELIIFTILRLPVKKHDIFLIFCKSSLIYLSGFYNFFVMRSYTYALYLCLPTWYYLVLLYI